MKIDLRRRRRQLAPYTLDSQILRQKLKDLET